MDREAPFSMACGGPAGAGPAMALRRGLSAAGRHVDRILRAAMWAWRRPDGLQVTVRQPGSS